MASHHVQVVVAVVLLLGLLLNAPSCVQSIGVCYGRNGGSLPSAADTVSLYKANGITAMRLYDPDHDALDALRGKNIQLILGVSNPDLASIASNPNSAAAWVQSHVRPYAADIPIRYIAVGNEVIPGDKANYVLPAMRNIKGALSAAGLDRIKVSTAVSQGVQQGFPPSQGDFTPAAKPTMQPIVQFLAQTGAPLLANVYPYFSYIGGGGNPLPYALFTAQGTVVHDPGAGQHNYQNLFDALVDTLYSALEKAGGSNVPIVVSESGWPSAGGGASTTVANGQTYNQNLINHVGKGTPKRPRTIEAYIFAMYDEDRKYGDETERHFGLFSPDKRRKYPISFN